MYLNILYTAQSRTGWIIFFVLGYLAAIIIGLGNYIQPFSLSFVLGSVAALSTFTSANKKGRSLLYTCAVALFLVLYYFIPAKTLLFIAVLLSVLTTLQSFFINANYRTLTALLIMSPIASYVFGLFGFSIRLFLTKVAGNLLKVVYPETDIEGNIIVTKLSAFSVDPACMGLHMLISSLLAGIILAGILEKKLTRSMSPGAYFMSLLVIFLFNIISNLLRILILVYFNIGPAQVMHEAVGMICFLAYVIAPTILFIHFFLRRYGKQAPETELSLPKLSPSRPTINFIMVLFIIVSSVSGRGRAVNHRIPVYTPNIPGYDISHLPDRIVKLENQQSLVYIKPIAGFYSTDHQPMICWAGSGYDFKNIREKNIAGHRIYHADLQTKSDKLYTAWWYASGSSTTLDQLEWRWNSFRYGNRYSLINVTAESPEKLEKEIGKLCGNAKLSH